jgi:hypothetical protein
MENKNRFDLEKLYKEACSEVSDIYMHLPVLYEYSKKCEHVTEMGARGGMSTRTFLYSKPSKFVSYDYQYSTPEPHLVESVNSLIEILEDAKGQGINCEYIGKDVLKVEIEKTDMLFIDTWHCYSQLKEELSLHAGRVNRYIAFHDTYLYGQSGEGYPSMDINHPNRDLMSGNGGILKAIHEFLSDNDQWRIVYETNENNGLIIIAKE